MAHLYITSTTSISASQLLEDPAELVLERFAKIVLDI